MLLKLCLCDLITDVVDRFVECFFNSLLSSGLFFQKRLYSELHTFQRLLELVELAEAFGRLSRLNVGNRHIK